MRVLVLDDELYRVNFLKEELGEEIEVHHAFTVREFARRLGIHVCDEEIDRSSLAFEPATYDLVILDHDLGMIQTGLDACDLLPDGFDKPVLVWSFNPKGAQRMMTTLARKNIRCYRELFGRGAIRLVKGLLDDRPEN